MGSGSHRVRRAARRHRRARRAHAQGHVAVRRRARQPRRLRQFRRRAGADPLFLGPAGARQCRLDRRHGVRDLRGPEAGALQCHGRRSEPAGLGGKFLHRHAGAWRRHHGAAADLCVLPVRRAALCSRDFSLHAGDRVPDGVADSGVLRQARRQAGGARDGAAGLCDCCAVLRAAGVLSVVGTHDRHRTVSRQPAVRLALVPRPRAQVGGRGGERGTG